MPNYAGDFTYTVIVSGSDNSFVSQKGNIIHLYDCRNITVTQINN